VKKHIHYFYLCVLGEETHALVLALCPLLRSTCTSFIFVSLVKKHMHYSYFVSSVKKHTHYFYFLSLVKKHIHYFYFCVLVEEAHALFLYLRYWWRNTYTIFIFVSLVKKHMNYFYLCVLGEETHAPFFTFCFLVKETWITIQISKSKLVHSSMAGFTSCSQDLKFESRLGYRLQRFHSDPLDQWYTSNYDTLHPSTSFQTYYLH
jgi:hypothetical protein